MAEAVYILCAVTSLLCAAMLIRAYRRQPSRLLLWSAICFVGLAANNLLVVIDLIIVPDTDLRVSRLVVASAGLFMLLFALIVEGKQA